MSKEILQLDSKMPDGGESEGYSKKLYITAFVGPEDKGGSRAWVQITTDRDYFSLSPEQVWELSEVLRKRLRGIKGFRATD